METNEKFNGSFDTIINNDELLRGIYSYGFEKPSNIQSRCIPIIQSGKDILAQSQSGTGKTGAFSIGCLSNIEQNNKLQHLIIAPTHELAMQIKEVITSLSKYMNIRIELIIGKTTILDSIESLNNNPNIVIGTPGRILDMINRKHLFTSDLRSLILDEADEILSFGFIDAIYNIIRYLPTECQVCLFSATIPSEIITMSNKFLDNPEQILIKKEDVSLQGIKQFFINVANYDWKLDTILDLYSKISINQCIIYINKKNTLYQLYNKLKEENLPVSYISSDLNSSERKDTLNNFRNGTYRILLSTDLLSRGIDIQQLSLVINFDLPSEKETYIHRIGRSGRYGRKGLAINLIDQNEVRQMKEIESYYKITIDEMPNNIEDYM
jgi:translation initiation factor 4A